MKMKSGLWLCLVRREKCLKEPFAPKTERLGSGRLLRV